jgi:hypothetical protein
LKLTFPCVLQQRKRALIEQDNRLLLDRLAIAMQTKNIDNHLVEKPFISLMELQRKKELKKIMIQNSRLLDRIQSTVPSYDHVLWEKEADHHVEILRNMTEFPELFVAPGTHKKGYDMKIVDAERAAAKEQLKSKSVVAGEGDNGEGKRTGTAGSGGVGRGRPGTSQQGFAGAESPNSQFSKGSGFVPYSYFPEEQYAQYQRNLQMQMQQQQQMQYSQQVQTHFGSSAGGGSQPPAYGYGMPGNDFTTQQQQLYAYHQQQGVQQDFQQPQAQRQPYPGSGSIHSNGSGGMNGAMPPMAYGGMNGQYPAGDMGGNAGAGYSGNMYYGQGQEQGGVKLPDIYQGQGSPSGGY